MSVCPMNVKSMLQRVLNDRNLFSMFVLRFGTKDMTQKGNRVHYFVDPEQLVTDHARLTLGKI